MNLNTKSFQVTIILIPVLLIAVYIINGRISQDKWSNEKLVKNYTVATIYEYRNPLKSTAFFKYNYKYDGEMYRNQLGLGKRIGSKNEKHTNNNEIISDFIKLSPEELETFVGKRFYVKFIADYPKNSELLLDKPVADSVINIPKEGWQENRFNH